MLMTLRELYGMLMMVTISLKYVYTKHCPCMREIEYDGAKTNNVSVTYKYIKKRFFKLLSSDMCWDQQKG